MAPRKNANANANRSQAGGSEFESGSSAKRKREEETRSKNGLVGVNESGKEQRANGNRTEKESDTSSAKRLISSQNKKAKVETGKALQHIKDDDISIHSPAQSARSQARTKLLHVEPSARDQKQERLTIHSPVVSITVKGKLCSGTGSLDAAQESSDVGSSAAKLASLRSKKNVHGIERRAKKNAQTGSEETRSPLVSSSHALSSSTILDKSLKVQQRESHPAAASSHLSSLVESDGHDDLEHVEITRRRRGRPPKALIPTVEAEREQVSRDHPVKGSEESLENGEEPEHVEITRRRRGRPPKISIHEAELGQASKDQPASVSKETPNGGEQAENVEIMRRRRGRPPKISTHEAKPEHASKDQPVHGRKETKVQESGKVGTKEISSSKSGKEGGKVKRSESDKDSSSSDNDEDDDDDEDEDEIARKDRFLREAPVFIDYELNRRVTRVRLKQLEREAITPSCLDTDTVKPTMDGIGGDSVKEGKGTVQRRLADDWDSDSPADTKEIKRSREKPRSMPTSKGGKRTAVSAKLGWEEVDALLSSKQSDFLVNMEDATKSHGSSVPVAKLEDKKPVPITAAIIFAVKELQSKLAEESVFSLCAQVATDSISALEAGKTSILASPGPLPIDPDDKNAKWYARLSNLLVFLKFLVESVSKPRGVAVDSLMHILYGSEVFSQRLFDFLLSLCQLLPDLIVENCSHSNVLASPNEHALNPAVPVTPALKRCIVLCCSALATLQKTLEFEIGVLCYAEPSERDEEKERQVRMCGLHVCFVSIEIATISNIVSKLLDVFDLHGIEKTVARRLESAVLDLFPVVVKASQVKADAISFLVLHLILSHKKNLQFWEKLMTSRVKRCDASVLYFVSRAMHHRDFVFLVSTLKKGFSTYAECTAEFMIEASCKNLADPAKVLDDLERSSEVITTLVDCLRWSSIRAYAISSKRIQPMMLTILNRLVALAENVLRYLDCPPRSFENLPEYPSNNTVLLKQDFDHVLYEKFLNASLRLFSFVSSKDNYMLLKALVDKHFKQKKDLSRLLSVISYLMALCTIRCTPAELSEVTLVFRYCSNLYIQLYVAEEARAARKLILLDQVEPENEEDIDEEEDQIEMTQDSAASSGKNESLDETVDEFEEAQLKPLCDFFERAEENEIWDHTALIDLKYQACVQRLIRLTGEGDQPPWYIKTRRNIYIAEAKAFDVDSKRNERMVCDCVQVPGGNACAGPECVNWSSKVECYPELCKAKETCRNQRFQKCEYPKVLRRKIQGQKGFAIYALEDIAAGSFIGEYQGEIVTGAEYEIRKRAYEHEYNFYFMQLSKDPELYVDASRAGTWLRFMNHSCDPNCSTQKWTVRGRSCVGIFAVKDIPKETELTFDYRTDEARGDRPVKCECGTGTCRGWLTGSGDGNSGKNSSASQGPDSPRTKKIRALRKLCEKYKKQKDTEALGLGLESAKVKAKYYELMSMKQLLQVDSLRNGLPARTIQMGSSNAGPSGFMEDDNDPRGSSLSFRPDDGSRATELANADTEFDDDGFAIPKSLSKKVDQDSGAVDGRVPAPSPRSKVNPFTADFKFHFGPGNNDNLVATPLLQSPASQSYPDNSMPQVDRILLPIPIPPDARSTTGPVGWQDKVRDRLGPARIIHDDFDSRKLRPLKLDPKKSDTREPVPRELNTSGEKKMIKATAWNSPPRKSSLAERQRQRPPLAIESPSALADRGPLYVEDPRVKMEDEHRAVHDSEGKRSYQAKQEPEDKTNLWRERDRDRDREGDPRNWDRYRDRERRRDVRDYEPVRDRDRSRDFERDYRHRQERGGNRERDRDRDGGPDIRDRHDQRRLVDNRNRSDYGHHRDSRGHEGRDVSATPQSAELNSSSHPDVKNEEKLIDVDEVSVLSLAKGSHPSQNPRDELNGALSTPVNDATVMIPPAKSEPRSFRGGTTATRSMATSFSRHVDMTVNSDTESAREADGIRVFSERFRQSDAGDFFRRGRDDGQRRRDDRSPPRRDHSRSAAPDRVARNLQAPRGDAEDEDRGKDSPRMRNGARSILHDEDPRRRRNSPPRQADREGSGSDGKSAQRRRSDRYARDSVKDAIDGNDRIESTKYERPVRSGSPRRDPVRKERESEFDRQKERDHSCDEKEEPVKIGSGHRHSQRADRNGDHEFKRSERRDTGSRSYDRETAGGSRIEPSESGGNERRGNLGRDLDSNHVTEQRGGSRSGSRREDRDERRDAERRDAERRSQDRDDKESHWEPPNSHRSDRRGSNRDIDRDSIVERETGSRFTGIRDSREMLRDSGSRHRDREDRRDSKSRDRDRDRDGDPRESGESQRQKDHANHRRDKSRSGEHPEGSQSGTRRDYRSERDDFGGQSSSRDHGRRRSSDSRDNDRRNGQDVRSRDEGSQSGTGLAGRRAVLQTDLRDEIRAASASKINSVTKPEGSVDSRKRPSDSQASKGSAGKKPKFIVDKESKTLVRVTSSDDEA